MKPSLLAKLEGLSERHQEITALLSDPDIISDQNKFRELSREYADLGPVTKSYQDYLETAEGIENANAMLQEDDAEMKELAQEELKMLNENMEALSQQLQTLLLPKDPHDDNNVFLEIRAGTGGDEAAIFAGDLYRIYSRYSESRRWQVEILSQNEGEHGGYREIILRIIGQGAYSRLKFESGAHRVQRVPETESQGRIHTSAATVAILPEVEDVEVDAVNPADLRVDTYRASGAGGQHVNKTDSAVRLTHLPSGIVVECQDERSQHKNKARAMSLLQAKLVEVERVKKQSAESEMRRDLVGSGDRSERIRTYNFPQGRVTDHRINLTLYKLDEVLGGSLDQVIDPLLQEYQADQLAALSEDT